MVTSSVGNPPPGQSYQVPTQVSPVPTAVDRAPEPGLGRPRWGWFTRRSLSRLKVRLLALLGVLLVVLSLTGWWLNTRVLSDQGFADVMAKTIRQPAVSQYISERISLQLAPTNKIFTAARPVATTVAAQVLQTDAVASAVHNVVAGVHHQVFQIQDNDSLVNVSGASAVATIKAALTSIDPKLAAKVPDSVLNMATTVTQNRTIALAAEITPYVKWGYLPAGVVGVFLLLLAFSKARDPVHAVRFSGLSMAVAGSLIIGLGAATPLFARVADTPSDPGRGAAVAAFIGVLFGRLVGAGGALALLGLLLAFVPGRDGAGFAVRARRWRARVDGFRMRRRGHVTIGLVALIVGLCVITVPTKLFYFLLWFLALIILFGGLLTVLRGVGVIETRPETAGLRKRQVSAVALAMVASIIVTTTATAAVIDAASRPHAADPQATGCNGYYELCYQPINRIVWAGSHNAMSSVAYNFFTAEHVASIPEQLNQGARALLIDAYNGYRSGGIVRTNFTGEINRQQIIDELGGDALRVLDRLGALTGATKSNPKGQDVYLCHLFCEVGAVKAAEVFHQIDDYLNQHLTDVIILDVEDYVSPATLEKALKAGGLWDRLYHVDLSKPMPTLLDLVDPPPGQDQARRRVIVTSENHANQAPWLIGSYQLMQETPYTFSGINSFNCRPLRGAPTNAFLLVNHWLRSPGPPDPVSAQTTNSQAVLDRRLKQCVAVRHRLPNIVAVDFFGIGDTVKVVNAWNAAIARVTGQSTSLDATIKLIRDDPSSTAKEIAELDTLVLLPETSEAQAMKLLGPIGPVLAAEAAPHSGSRDATPASGTFASRVLRPG
jgi:hypothetical protein